VRPKNKGGWYTERQKIQKYHDVVWFVDKGSGLRINIYIKPTIVIGKSCLLHTIDGYKYCWYSTTFIDDIVWLLHTTNCYPNQPYTSIICWNEVAKI